MNDHSAEGSPVVAIVMGSRSDWQTLQEASRILDQFSVPHHVEVISAHRTPEKLAAFAKGAAAAGFRAIIAGAGGAAHLPGMIAAHTTAPVLGVPVESSVLRGMDSLLSIVQMPRGVPVATFAIGGAGAANAALHAVAMLAVTDASLRRKLEEFRAAQTQAVLNDSDPRVERR